MNKAKKIANPARTKAKNDMALNLSELAQVTGYGRSVIQKMDLPLVCGKLRLRDFWRIMRERQDWLRKSRSPAAPQLIAASASPGANHSTQATVDKFRAPRSKNGQPNASPSPAGSHVRSTV